MNVFEKGVTVASKHSPGKMFYNHLEDAPEFVPRVMSQ